MAENEPDRKESLRLEYQIVESKWRFFQGLRYGVFAFLTTTHGVLFTAYQAIYTAIEKNPQNPEGLGWPALVMLPIIALLILLGCALLERRLRYLYSRCSARGAAIESLLGIIGGIFSILEVSRPGGRLPHTRVFIFTLIVVGIAWTSLIYLSITLAPYRNLVSILTLI